MKLDYQSLAGGNKFLIALFGRVYRHLSSELFLSENEQAQILAHLCAKLDQDGWYSPSGGELLESIAMQFFRAYDAQSDKWDVDLLAELLAGHIDRAWVCIRFEPPPTLAQRTLLLGTKDGISAPQAPGE